MCLPTVVMKNFEAGRNAIKCKFCLNLGIYFFWKNFITISFNVGGLISLWIFLFRIYLFAALPKEFFLDVLKKLEQPSHKCVELRGNM
jgi:hypothetical protein